MVLTTEQVGEVRKLIQERLEHTLRVQGHFMTGRVAREINLVVEETVGSVSLLLYVLKYGRYLETGTAAANVPFSPGSGRKHSKYIAALVGWVEKRQGLQGKEALSRAFQIAYTHKREGIPSTGSKAFSQTGERTKWISNAMRDTTDPLRELLRKNLRGNIEVQLINLIKKYQA